MASGRGQLRLGAFFHPTGHHTAAWRHPDAQADAGINFEHYKEITQTAERAKFDMVFLADNLSVREGRMEAWATGFDLLKTHPLFGAGMTRFTEFFYITAHNTIMVCAAETGMFGLFWWSTFEPVLPFRELTLPTWLTRKFTMA